MKKALAMGLTLALLLGVLAGCGPQIVVQYPSNVVVGDGTYQNEALAFERGTELRMAVGYNNLKTGLFFDADVAKDGIVLADGVTYTTGSLKPTWVAVENQLGMKFVDKYQGNTDSKEFEYWKEKLDQVDMVSGTATTLGEYGTAGQMLNINDFLDVMPNFKKYLDNNPIVRLSVTSDTKNGGIYLSPYFDGVNDIERMPLMRTDWVVKLLDGEGAFTADKSDTTKATVYEPYMPLSGKVDINVVKADGSGVDTVTKDYDTAGNIVAKMNAVGPMSGVEAVNMLRDYIDQAYGGYYGTQRSDLFVGQNAAWDADELVALLRCVTANSATLNANGEQVQGLFTREENNTQRRLDLVHLAGHLFGVRGLESRKEYLYVGTDNLLHDARQEAETYEALDRMNAMAKEGLISSSFLAKEEVTSEMYLENDLGFMHYDYNQTQTLYNGDEQYMTADSKRYFDEGEQYMAAMVPVARWYDGTDPNGVYMRFTESWRSVKTGGWGISISGVGYKADQVTRDEDGKIIAIDNEKLKACLALVDFAYTHEGMLLLSYGPKEFRAGTEFTFNGEKMPEISDACRADLWKFAGGNYTNYARQYLGATLSFVKCQSFEYQCTTEVGRKGAGYISNAIALGTIKHPELAVMDNGWYTSVPTILPTTKIENDQINGYTSLGSTVFGTSSDQRNMLVDVMVSGYTDAGMTDAASAAKVVAENYSGRQYLATQNTAWQRSLELYESMK